MELMRELRGETVDSNVRQKKKKKKRKKRKEKRLPIIIMEKKRERGSTHQILEGEKASL